MTSPHPRDRNLLADLEEQLAFLRNSCVTYDAGFEPEAKRIAVVVRTLVHDTASSRSLLHQMAVKTAIQWNDSAKEIDPHNLISTTGLTMMGSGPNGFTFVPRTGEQLRTSPNLRTVSFDEWWTRSVIKDSNEMEFSRSDLVRALANRDGGAHIDRLQASTFALAHENSSGWIVLTEANPGGQPASSPIFPSVRTIAEELSTTLQDQWSAITGVWSARGTT